MTHDGDHRRPRAGDTYQRLQRVRVIAFLVLFAVALALLVIFSLT